MKIVSIKLNENELECRSERMCIHIGFYVISLYCLGTVDRIIKKNMPGMLFFIISQFFCIVRTYFVPGGVGIYR
jgi:hypothetical protein